MQYTSVMIEQRVISLENLMSQLIQTVEQTSREMREFKEEMHDFKDEMREERREFKEEMHDFKDEMREERREFKEEMHDFKDEMHEEMREFKKEMSKFKDEMHEERRLERDERKQLANEMRILTKDMNKKWGEMSHKLGTMADDLVAPSIPRIVRTVIACTDNEVESAVRVKRTHPITRQQREFDVVATCGNYLFINETKSRLRPEDVTDFAEKTLPTARDYFPEHADKKVIGVMASLYVDKSLVRNAERAGLIMLGFGEDVMDVLNSAGFVAKEW